MVFVIDQHGQPLMPTERHGKVRRMLKSGKAKVIRRCPFIIQLLYETSNITQPVSLGVDAGSKHIGISAATEAKVLYEADVAMRTDVVKLIATRRGSRRTRRNRKTRYRRARFDNRCRPDGWLAPSVRQKIQTHLTVLDRIYRFLPVTELIVETASFDIQKIRDPEISGAEYQQGEQLGFWNVREYVLFRDGHECQCCHGRSGDKHLNVHHIESRRTGGNAPNNLITLCETCHNGYHSGTVKLPENIKRDMRFRDAAFMGIMRWALYNELKERYPNVRNTYGYITKNTRTRNNLLPADKKDGDSKGYPVNHVFDARCISGHPMAKPSGVIYYQRKVRCHNRQIHKYKIPRGGVRKRNQADYTVKDFRLFDKVLYKGQECFIFGRRATGRMDIRLLDGTHVSPSVSHKKLKLVEARKNYLIERRTA